MNNIRFGRVGEDAAVMLLEAQGYEILDRNYKCSCGEIDIIAVKDADISFVEVKTRKNSIYGRPCEAVDHRKQRHIRDAAICYLRDVCKRQCVFRRMHFDVIEIVMEHIIDSF